MKKSQALKLYLELGFNLKSFAISDKIKKYYIQPYFCDNKIVIQNKANTKFGASKRAYETLKKELGRTYCETWDIFEDNCGEINNKPVLFDYCEIPSRK
jgi:hypothetical protein